MSPRHQALAMMALAVLTISLGGCFDDPIGSSRCFDIIYGEVSCPVVEVRDKTIEVTIITAGEDIDPDGYILEIREEGDLSGAGWPVSVNGKETYSFGGGPDGNHTVKLGDVASNCVVSGDNPRVVWISYSQTAKTTFEIQCAAIPRQPDPLSATEARVSQRRSGLWRLNRQNGPLPIGALTLLLRCRVPRSTLAPCR